MIETGQKLIVYVGVLVEGTAVEVVYKRSTGIQACRIIVLTRICRWFLTSIFVWSRFLSVFLASRGRCHIPAYSRLL